MCLQTIWRTLEILEINRAGLLRLRQDSPPSPARFHLERIAQSNFDARTKNAAQRKARHRPSGRRRCISQLKREDGRQHAIDHELAVTGDVLLPVRISGFRVAALGLTHRLSQATDTKFRHSSQTMRVLRVNPPQTSEFTAKTS